MLQAPAHDGHAQRPALDLLPAFALQRGHWECCIGSAGQSQWVSYEWPISAILEQAYCRGKAYAEFRSRSMSYKVEFSSLSILRSQEAATPFPGVAVQLNLGTGARRQVRRWRCREGKEEHAQFEAQQIAQQWVAWNHADWTWLLLDNAGATLQAPQPSPQPQKARYGLHGCSFNAEFWPPVLRAWPTEDLACAVHPHGERCNFALQRLLPSDCAHGGEWAQLAGVWQQGGLASKGAKLIGAFRVQNRGLIHGFAALRQAMLARLAASEDFADGQSREQCLAVKLLWHGTRSVAGLLDICRDGFDRAHAQVCVHGKGCYFAASAAYSDKYACAVQLPGRPASMPVVRAMLLAAVLVGELTEGSNNMYPPPPKPHSLTGDRFENACDKLSNPKIFVTFKDHQACPAYIVLYEP